MPYKVGLSKEWCANFITTTCYTVNQPSHPTLVVEMPYKVWIGEHVDNGSPRVFNCTTYYHIKDKKLDPINKKIIFMGYAKGVKG